MPKYSIITIACNGIEHTVKCVESIFRHTKDFELIVVDSNTTDGTMAYLEGQSAIHPEIKIIDGKQNRSFAANNNIGLMAVDPSAEYIIYLNNDTIVTKDWLDRMEAHFTRVPLPNLAAVGPVSNMTNGKQMVGQQDPEQWHASHRGSWRHTGILYGWCMMIKKAVVDEVGGFDERFHNSWEDNDLCLRIQHAGYTLAIAADTYIHHTGQGTLRTVWNNEEYIKNGAEMREVFFNKYYTPEVKKKLVAVYRTNGGAWLEKSLEQTSKFADSIIIHFCRAPKELTLKTWLGETGTGAGFDGTREEYCDDLKFRFPKIVKIGFYDGIFQEDYERGWLLDQALELQAKGQANWCISIDDDELYEDKFIYRVQAMMNPRNPQTMGYWMQWRTIWETRKGREMFRTDSTFGQFSNYRMWKLIPGQKIITRHPEGHHCGSAPWLADENLQWTNIRVKHMGYDTPEQRQKKFEFYQKNDNFKTRADIGFDDYSHLISKNPELEYYNEKQGISCIMMLKNEAEWIEGCLENIVPMMDEFIIVNTGSTDGTFDIVEKFAKHAAIPVRILSYPWEDNYSTPRNFAKLHATQPWVMFMDADERFRPEQIKDLWKLTELELDVVLLNVWNYLEEPHAHTQPKIAPTQAARLFRNIPDFYLTGIIHETLDDAIGAYRRRSKINVAVAPLELHHYGYLKDKDRLKEKLEYYENLNERQIEITEGKDPRPYFNLALHYMQDGQENKALEMFQKVLKIEPRFWYASQQIGILNVQSAKTFLTHALEYMPDNHQAKKQLAEMVQFINTKSNGFEKV
jgi:GT2 family glycosyltransferase/tetratricopeptide (TPR) repeat protein